MDKYYKLIYNAVYDINNANKYHTSGYFLDPVKITCSRKWAIPGISGGSLKLPTSMQSPHAA